jgi:Putative auto-transporter adhesin, head GIN domain
MSTRTRLAPRILTVAAVTALAVVSGACDIGGTRGEGAVTTETREVDAFSTVDTSNGINVSIVIGDPADVEVSAQGNILPIIETAVASDTLRIRSTKGFSTSEGVDVVITTPQLGGIVLSGGSHGSVDGLAADTFDVELSGGSVLGANGTAGTMSLATSGGSVAELKGLTAGTVAVDVSGGSRAEVSATDAVGGSASGGSHVSVFGDAATQVDASGGASVDHPS